MRMTRRAAIGGAMASAACRPAFAATKPVTYLLPAPATLPAFLPFQLAQKRNYFAANGLAVTFATGHGGADVAKQVGVGNADLGGGVGETSMIVRPNGIPIRGVALLGQRPLFELVTRQAAAVHAIEDLRGKKLGVSSYQDTGYYALLAVLAARGIKRTELQIEQVGAAGVVQLMIANALDGIMGVPEWSDAITAAGVPLDYFPIDRIFPAMAQAIMASDDTIKQKPELVRGCVAAVLQAVRDCIADPAAAAKDYVAAVPQHAGQEAQIERILRRYVGDVYHTDPPSALGRFDPQRLRTVQAFYLKNEIIQGAVPIDDLYTNQFVS
ncbi:MAG: ABC transporter substrate-binding protein [Xanthobacteraceae bacterium]